MSLPAGTLLSDPDEIEGGPEPVLSLAEVRRLIIAAATVGKTPAAFLHDTVVAAIEDATADEDLVGKASRDWIAPARDLADAIRAMIEPIDEILTLADTIPVRIELDEEASRRLAELLANPPEPNEYLKAAFADYRRTLAAGGAPSRR